MPAGQRGWAISADNEPRGRVILPGSAWGRAREGRGWQREGGTVMPLWGHGQLWSHFLGQADVGIE